MTGVIAAQVCGPKGVFSTRGQRNRATEAAADRERTLPRVRRRVRETRRRRDRRGEPRLPAVRLPRLDLVRAVARRRPSGLASFRLLSASRGNAGRAPCLATLPRAVIPAVRVL